jgi:hypothetical protein
MMENGAEADENPGTSEATRRKSNFCGGSTSDSTDGVVPEMVKLPASNLNRDGRGALSPDTA